MGGANGEEVIFCPACWSCWCSPRGREAESVESKTGGGRRICQDVHTWREAGLTGWLTFSWGLVLFVVFWGFVVSLAFLIDPASSRNNTRKNKVSPHAEARMVHSLAIIRAQAANTFEARKGVRCFLSKAPMVFLLVCVSLPPYLSTLLFGWLRDVFSRDIIQIPLFDSRPCASFALCVGASRPRNDLGDANSLCSICGLKA